MCQAAAKECLCGNLSLAWSDLRKSKRNLSVVGVSTKIQADYLQILILKTNTFSHLARFYFNPIQFLFICLPTQHPRANCKLSMSEGKEHIGTIQNKEINNVRVMVMIIKQ
jgi:hypothetical protein